jgi:hypothetical protein
MFRVLTANFHQTDTVQLLLRVVINDCNQHSIRPIRFSVGSWTPHLTEVRPINSEIKHADRWSHTFNVLRAKFAQQIQKRKPLSLFFGTEDDYAYI